MSSRGTLPSFVAQLLSALLLLARFSPLSLLAFLLHALPPIPPRFYPSHHLTRSSFLRSARPTKTSNLLPMTPPSSQSKRETPLPPIPQWSFAPTVIPPPPHVRQSSNPERAEIPWGLMSEGNKVVSSFASPFLSFPRSPPSPRSFFLAALADSSQTSL